MTWLLLAMATILVVGPMLALLPNARQREQQRFRKEALIKGIRVELVSVDDPAPDPEEYLSATGMKLEPRIRCIAYRKHRRDMDRRASSSAGSFRLARVSAEATRFLPRDVHPVEGLPLCWYRMDRHGDELHPRLLEALAEWLPRLPEDVLLVEDKAYTLSVYWREHGGEAALETVLDFLDSLASLKLPYQAGDEDSEEIG